MIGSWGEGWSLRFHLSELPENAMRGVLQSYLRGTVETVVGALAGS